MGSHIEFPSHTQTHRASKNQTLNLRQQDPKNPESWNTSHELLHATTSMQVANRDRAVHWGTRYYSLLRSGSRLLRKAWNLVAPVAVVAVVVVVVVVVVIVVIISVLVDSR